MPHILLLEPDRVIADCISKILIDDQTTVSIASNADNAVELADKKSPDVVISELSVSGHSGSEFLYEFRTYSDWKQVPIIVFSSLKPSKDITSSKDWGLLRIHEFLYKPDKTIHQLKQAVMTALDT
jgi:DNA-binding response OmpR family regulator